MADLLLEPRALQVWSRAEQHEHRESHREAQKAPPADGEEAASRVPHRLLSAPAARADGPLQGGPALLELVPDPPQARGEQLCHGARGGRARAAAGLTWPQKRLIHLQPAHLFSDTAAGGPHLFKVFRKKMTLL